MSPTQSARRAAMRLGGAAALCMVSGMLAAVPRAEARQIEPLAQRSARPNIIVLLADDLGYGDLSSYGSSTVHTPNIDALAERGTRLTRFYAASAVCTPSRAALLTGMFPLRFDIRRQFTDQEEHLPAGTRTLAHVLRDEGYATAHIGKWHLGGLRVQDFEARAAHEPANPGPLQHGFDHALTSIEDPPIRRPLIRERQLYRRGGEFMVRNDRRAPPTDRHWTDIKVDEAIGLIDSYDREARPFFLNLWFDVPHTPYEPAPEPHLSPHENLGATGDQLLFRSMMSHLDANIGRLMAHLERLGISENTLVIFTSDNGPAWQGSPGPFRGGKTDLHEGGIRVPFIAVWPGRIPANRYSFQTMHMADLLPTITAAVGAPAGIAGLDGQNLMAQLEGAPMKDRGVLLWQMDLFPTFQNQGPKPEPYATAAVRRGRWKLLTDSLRPTELFDLEQDHRELYNLLEKEPEIAAELLEELRGYYAAPRRRWPAPAATGESR